MKLTVPPSAASPNRRPHLPSLDTGEGGDLAYASPVPSPFKAPALSPFSQLMTVGIGGGAGEDSNPFGVESPTHFLMAEMSPLAMDTSNHPPDQPNTPHG
jgi:hypothetical protein